MKNESVSGLQTLLAELKETPLNLPVIIGGIAGSKATVYATSHKFGTP